MHVRRGVRTSGVIVEVEAYIGESDPACHAAPGPTRRNEPLYGAPGHAYVYLNYGIHCLANVVTEAQGSPAAVLLRALAPLEGVDVMRRRRAREMKGRRRLAAGTPGDDELCRGPGNLTMAMGITLAENRVDLGGDRLFVEDRGVHAGADRLGAADRHQGRHRSAVEGVRERLPGGVEDVGSRLRAHGSSGRLRNSNRALSSLSLETRSCVVCCGVAVPVGASRQRLTRLHPDPLRARECPGLLARPSESRRPAGRCAVHSRANVERAGVRRAVRCCSLRSG